MKIEIGAQRGIQRRKRNMRKFVVALFIFTFVISSIPGVAYARKCTDDTPLDKFGDWFGNLGKKEKSRQRNIAVRKANRLAECAEKEKRALEAAGAATHL